MKSTGLQHHRLRTGLARDILVVLTIMAVALAWFVAMVWLNASAI